MRSQKRSKTFPLASNDEDTNTLCRSSTTPVLELKPTPEASLLNRQTGTGNEISTQGEDAHGSTEDSPHKSLPNHQADTDQQSQAPSESGNEDAHEDTVEKLSESDGDGLPTSNGDENEVSAGEYKIEYYSTDEEWEAGSIETSYDKLNQELGRWTVPQEPLRPENPYKKGRILEILKHTACPPFGGSYPDYEGVRQRARERELRGKTLVELCLDRPPIGGETATDEKAHTLEIMDEIRVKEDGGAQVVVCRFSGLQQQVVAKIYDPLYYGYADRWLSSRPRDVTYEADIDYAREVAAYLELNDQFGGTDIPEYHGSWTFQMPLDLPDGRKMRDVRLVLMEHIKGTVMTDLKPESFSEPTRMDLVARWIEALQRILFAGVSHGDVSQRNVMVCCAKPDAVERVVMIDFNFAGVKRLEISWEIFSDIKPKPKPKKPLNPINRWWDGDLYGKAGEWFPKSWECRLRPLQEWLYERYYESEEYEPPRIELEWDEENVPRMWIAS